MATLLKNKAFFDENAIDLDFLKAHETVESHGTHHYPIAHSLILDKFRTRAAQLGLKLGDEKGALSKNGEKYMYVANVLGDNDKDYHLSVGFRSFNDRSVAFQGSCGAHVLICCNGMQTSVIVPSKQKHTIGNFGKLDDKIGIIFDRFAIDGQKTIQQIETFKSVPYSDELLGKFILALGRSGAVGNTNIMKILSEVDNPTLNDKNDNTAWRIMNAATYVTTHRISNPMNASTTAHLMSNTLMGLIDPNFKPLGDADPIIDVTAESEAIAA